MRGSLPKMDDRVIGEIDGSMGLLNPSTQIYVFKIEEISWIETTQSSEELGSTKHKSPAQEGNIDHMLIADISHFVVIETSLNKEL